MGYNDTIETCMFKDLSVTEDITKRKEPRSGANYAIVAVTFFIIGILVGAFGFDRLSAHNQQENETLIRLAVDEALAAQSESLADSVVAALLDNAQGGAPQQGPDPNRRYEVDLAGDPAIGAEDAPVVIVEYSDFQCSYCKRFHDETYQQLVDAYGDQIRFVYKDFPILGEMSLVGALAAECAHDQDAFWDYHDLLFANQGTFNRDQFISFANQLELDVDTFTTCLDDQEHLEEVTADYEEIVAIGGRGTPAFLINGRFISGAQPFTVFADYIEEELNAPTETEAQ